MIHDFNENEPQKHGETQKTHFMSNTQYKDLPNIKIKFTSGKIPEKKSKDAAAYDVYSPEKVELKPGKTTIVSLGFSVEIPVGYELKVVPRSGLSTKGVTIANSPGTIDSDYRGEVGVILKYEPEDLSHRVDKLYKALCAFCKNLTTLNQINIDEARNRLLDKISDPMPPYVIEAGDRIAQIQLQKVVNFEFIPTKDLSYTERGTGGFGSSGK